MKAAPAPAHPPFACDDFPTWVPAVLVKELRQGLHTRGFFAIVVLFHAVMVVAMTTTVIALPGATAQSTGLPDKRINDTIWIMNAGTTTAHIMIPGE